MSGIPTLTVYKIASLAGDFGKKYLRRTPRISPRAPASITATIFLIVNILLALIENLCRGRDSNPHGVSPRGF